MPRTTTPGARNPASGPVLEARLLGLVPFETSQQLQQRLVYEASGRGDQHIDLLVCEHPLTITIGRGGSWAQIHPSRAELARRDVPLYWLGRGGGAMVHVPGQLALYPIVPLARLGWTLGEYLRRLQSSVIALLKELKVAPTAPAGGFGASGRMGRLATLGVSVRHDVASLGLYLNVSPSLPLLRWVDSGDGPENQPSSLLAERQGAVKMATVREAAIRQLAQALDAEQLHVHSGHPALTRITARGRRFAGTRQRGGDSKGP